MSGQSLRPIAERLSHMRCFTPDLRGHGANRLLPFSSLERCADDIAHFITCEAKGPVHIFGLSLGGYVALNLLAQQRIHVASAIISGVAFADVRGKWALKRLIGAVYPLLGIKGIREAAGRLAGLEDAELMSDPEGLSWARPSTVRDLAQAILRSNPTDLVQRIAVPSLILAGAAEPSAVRRGLDQISTASVTANTGLVMESSHGWCLNNPDLAARVIDSWIRNEPLPPGIQLVGAGLNLD